MEENIEFTADAPVMEPAAPQGPSRSEMRRVFSRIGLGLCLGLLASQLAPSLLTVLFPTFDAQAHAFLVGGLCTGCFTLPVLCWAESSPPNSRRGTPSVWAGSWPWCASALPV